MIVEISEGSWFRPMERADIQGALRIIEEFDDEDVPGATASFNSGLDGYFVVETGGAIVSVTGATHIDGTDRSYVLGWTATCDAGAPHLILIQTLLEAAKEMGVRKLFAQVSDYLDPVDGDVYGPLKRALVDLGFQEEIKHANYYDRDESQYVFGLRLAEENFVPPEPEPRQLRLTDIDDIPETESCFWLSWELSDSSEPLTRDAFTMIINQVRDWGGSSIFIGFPSCIPAAADAMRTGDFSFVGRLADFYEDGIDELRFRYDL